MIGKIDTTVKGLMVIASCKNSHHVDVAEQWIARAARYIPRDAWKLLIYTLDQKVSYLNHKGV